MAGGAHRALVRGWVERVDLVWLGGLGASSRIPSLIRLWTCGAFGWPTVSGCLCSAPAPGPDERTSLAGAEQNKRLGRRIKIDLLDVFLIGRCGKFNDARLLDAGVTNGDHLALPRAPRLRFNFLEI